jgi:hypothetical protein
MKYIHSIEDIENIKTGLKKVCYISLNNSIKKILESISKDYDIPLETLNEKYLHNTPIDNTKGKEDKCISLTIKGTKCTRKKQIGEKYCKKHLLLHQKKEENKIDKDSDMDKVGEKNGEKDGDKDSDKDGDKDGDKDEDKDGDKDGDDDGNKYKKKRGKKIGSKTNKTKTKTEGDKTE